MTLQERAEQWINGKYIISDSIAQADRIIHDLLVDIERLKNNDRLMHETNCKLSLLALIWKDAKICKPESGKIVLIHCVTEQLKRSIPLRAVWYDRFTEEDNWNENEATEYCEEKDAYFVCEGWYEFNQCDEVNWAITDTVTHWAEIPLPPVE